MVVFDYETHPSCKFYEALGGEKIYFKNGNFMGYGWDNLKKLVADAGAITCNS